jgi:uracil-DNA glycosylase
MIPDEYSGLVAQRKRCRLCPKLQNPAAILGGTLDSDELGPYSRWQGSLDAELLVVAQDFADAATFVRLDGWPGDRVSTNLALTELLNEAGFPAQPPRREKSDDVVFLTNAVLCMKQGPMSASVPRVYFETCGRHFLRPTIELIQPRAVVALGSGALDALRAAYGVPDRAPLRDLVERSPAARLSAITVLFAMFHPSPTVRNTVRSLETQREDWRRLGRWLRAA